MALDFPLVPYPYPYDEFWEDAMLSVQNHLAANQKSYVDEEATLPPVLPPLPNNHGIQFLGSSDIFTSKFHSYRPDDDQTRMVLPDLHMRLKPDMKQIEAPISFLSSVFVLDQSFNVQDFIKNNSHIFHEGRIHAIGCLESERHIADYFNTIAIAAYECPGFSSHLSPPDRYWTGGKSNEITIAGPWRAKPDIVLVKSHPISGAYDDSSIFWPDVLALAETSVSSGPTKTMTEGIDCKSYLMLYSQGDRVYSTSLSLYRDQWYLHIIDRQGKINIGPLTYAGNTEELVRVLLCLTFGPLTILGLDSTMTREVPSGRRFLKEGGGPNFWVRYSKKKFVPRWKNGVEKSTITPPDDIYFMDLTEKIKQQYIIAGDKQDLKQNISSNLSTISCDHTFIVKSEIFKSQALFGRATRVWAVETPDQKQAIMKDSWILSGRRHNESHYLQELHKDGFCPFIPKPICYAVVTKTSVIRTALFSYDSPETRERRRLVMSPVCVKLSNVQSLIELMGVFLDICFAIKFLKDHNRVHRDISFANIMIRNAPLTEQEIKEFYSEGNAAGIIRLAHQCRPGILIDFDYAAFIESNRNSACGSHQQGPLQASYAYQDASDLHPQERESSLEMDTDSSAHGHLPRSNYERRSTRTIHTQSITEEAHCHDTDEEDTDQTPVNSGSPVPQLHPRGIDGHSSFSAGVSSERSLLQDLHDIPQTRFHEQQLPITVSSPNTGKNTIRTGTAPFMAIPLLLWGSTHTVGFDLESLFYVLLYLCTQYQDINPVEIYKDGLFKKAKRYAPIAAWFFGDGSFQDLGCLKAGQLHFGLEHLVLDYISPRFQVLRTVIKDLWRALYPAFPHDLIQGDEKTRFLPADACDSFIEIFERAIVSLGKQQGEVSPADAFTSVSGSTKRRAEQEEEGTAKRILKKMAAGDGPV